MVDSPQNPNISSSSKSDTDTQSKPAEKVGSRPSVINAPADAAPGEVSDAAINANEQARKDRIEAEHKATYGELPQATMDEMNAGKEALKRHAPVDADKKA